MQEPCRGEASWAMGGSVKVFVTAILLPAVVLGLLSFSGCSPAAQEPSEEESAVEEAQQPQNRRSLRKKPRLRKIRTPRKRLWSGLRRRL